MNDRLSSELNAEFWKESEYEIAEVGEGEYNCYIPGQGAMQSFYIMYKFQRLIIFGDLSPGRNGVVSDLNYGLRWFAGASSAPYLAEKFLSKSFQPKYAQSVLEDFVKDWKLELADDNLTEDESRDIDKKIRKSLEAIDSSESGYGPCWDERDWYDFCCIELNDEDLAGLAYTYDLRDWHVLIGIQRVFGRLYLRDIVGD